MAQRPGASRTDASGPAQAEAPPSVAEWIAAGIGLVLLLASVGYLLTDHARGDTGPPVPLVQVTAIEPQGGRHLVRLRITNQSGGTAAALRVEGELRRGAEVVERSELEIDFLPARSSREGGLFFAHDPRTLQLQVHPRSYSSP